MFFKFIAKYALATHLALLASLPGAIAPFISGHALAVVILYLSLFSLIWLLAEPSVLKGERLSSARKRVQKKILFDPLFWFFIIAIIFGVIRWANCGVALSYDSEQSIWLVAKPVLDFMPASSGNIGFLPMAVVIACSIIVLGVRHALGLAARLMFGLLSSFIMGLGGLAVVICSVSPGFDALGKAMSVHFDTVNQFGVLFGSWLIVSIASGIYAEAKRWSFARLLFFIGFGGNATALIFFAPPLIVLAFIVLTLIYSIFSLVVLKRTGVPGSVARSFAFLLLGIAIPAFSVAIWMPESVQLLKLKALDPTVAFNEMYVQTSDALSRIAREMWMSQPWCGVGLDAFKLHVPFIAEKADWAIIPTEPICAVNSFWTILAERGIIGSSIILVGLGLLVYFYIARLIESYIYNSKCDESGAFVYVCAPVVWCPLFIILIYFVCGVFSTCLLNELMVFAIASPLVLAISTFPRKPRESDVSQLRSKKEH